MSKNNFKPENMNTVNPYLIVANPENLINLAKHLFNATLRTILYRENGQIMHIELVIGDSVIMAGEPMPNQNTFPGSLFVYVENCDEVYKKAINYGCDSIMEPTFMKQAGAKYGGVSDKNGNIWWIATHLK